MSAGVFVKTVCVFELFYNMISEKYEYPNSVSAQKIIFYFRHQGFLFVILIN